MSVQVRRRREAASFLATFVGAQGELLVDTTNNRVQVHDGATPGGFPAAKLADLPSATSPLALAQGGTGVSAASTTAALTALGAIGRTAVADAAYTAGVADRTIVFTALTASRTVTLPAAAAYPTGTTLTIFDETGACSSANAIVVARAGADTINGATSVTITTAYGYVAIESNGASKWTVVDSVPTGSGGSGTTAVSNGGTGATTASGARVNLGAAASGANSDITSLTGLGTALLISQGGTGASTGPAALVALGAIGRTAVNDAGVAATATSRTIAYTAITAPRAVALPAASAFPTGTQLLILDESGACSATNTITVTAAGSDKINGATSAVMASGYAYVAIESNGSNAWTVVDLSTGSLAQQSATSVAITGGTIDGTPIGATTKSTGAFTTLAVTTALTLPANSVANGNLAQMPTLTLKSNITGATATPADSTLSAIIDASQGSTRGAILYRGASGWSVLAPGASGTVLTANGTGADPTYLAVGGAASPSVPVRQTVMGGPAASGAPSFLPTTSASLTLTAQNISATVPLTLTAAQGSGASGASNLVYQFTTNPSWTLTASATNYLFVNASTGATSAQTLIPIYQFGGTISTTNNQFTFDYQAMVGYLGNGTTAVATPIVCVGEAVAGASTVTSAIAYAYNGKVVTQPVTPLPTGAGAAVTMSHNIGGQIIREPRIFIENITSELGFSVGDRVTPLNGYSGSNPKTSLEIWTSRLQGGYVIGNDGAFVLNWTRSGAVGVVPTAANWRYSFVFDRGW